MIYLDTSSLLKLLIPEPGSIATNEALRREELILISQLAELETLVRVRSGVLSGRYSSDQYLALLHQVSVLRRASQYRFVQIPDSVFSTALRQHESRTDLQCKSLDRLHLAAMEELGVRRIMTNDDQQARAARDLGYKVLQPGRAHA